MATISVSSTHRAHDPADDGDARVALGFGREELLVHDLVAEHEQQGGHQKLEPLRKRQVAQHLKVRGRQRGVQTRPAAGLHEEHGRGDDADDGDQRADGHIHIGDRGHAGQGRGDDDEGGDDPGAEFRRDRCRER